MPSRPTEIPTAKAATVQGSAWRRWLLLISSLTLMIAGIVVGVSTFVDRGSRELFAGTFFKVGMVLGLAWLAAPQLEKLGWERMRGTGLAIIVAIGAITAVKPRFGAMAAGIFIGGFLVLAVLGWVRGVIFSDTGKATTSAKTRKIEKNPTKR
jgi:uncharacterized membrane protein HdeD (DUF308 family)